MPPLAASDQLAFAITAAVQHGNVEDLRRLLHEHPELANTAVITKTGTPRTPVLIATDWPGHFPNVGATIAALAAAGADVNVHLPPHPKDPNCVETPLHQA